MKVNLASSKNKKPVDTQSKPIHLAVTKDRRYFVDSKEIPFGDLENVISKSVQGTAEPIIVLHIDKDLSWQDAIDVMQIGDRLKCKMVCATKPSNAQ